MCWAENRRDPGVFSVLNLVQQMFHRANERCWGGAAAIQCDLFYWHRLWAASLWPLCKLRSEGGTKTNPPSSEWGLGPRYVCWMSAQWELHMGFVTRLYSMWHRGWRVRLYHHCKALISIWVNPVEPTQVKAWHSSCSLESLQELICCNAL